jgi:hypothetical protein
VATGSTSARSPAVAIAFASELQLGKSITSGGTSRRSWPSATGHGWQDCATWSGRKLTRSSGSFPEE